MTGKHKRTPLRFRPPEAERVWLEARQEETGEPMNAILTAAVRALMATAEPGEDQRAPVSELTASLRITDPKENGR